MQQNENERFINVVTADMSSDQQRPSIADHLRKFAATTSVRGVSRVFKSGDRVLRVLWAFAVVSCAAMLAYQLTRVISQYLRYDFSTVTREDIWSQTVS